MRKKMLLLLAALLLSGCASAMNQEVLIYSEPPSSWRIRALSEHGDAPMKASLNNGTADLEVEFTAPGYETAIVPLRSHFHLPFLGGWWFQYDREVRVTLRPSEGALAPAAPVMGHAESEN